MPDGIIYLSCFRFKDTDDTELMYADFWMRIKSIETEIWKSYVVENVVLAMTSKKNFRHDLTDKWKADRKPKPESEMTEKQLEAHRDALKLRNYVSKVKVLLNKRMSSAELNRPYRVAVNNIAEADDTVIDLAHQGWLVVSMDSDIIKQSPEPVFNYHKAHWKWSEGNDYTSICGHILIESIAGTHNGAGFGVKGKGLKTAEKLIDGGITFDEFVNLYPTPEEMLMNVRCISCGQVKNGKLELLDVLDVASMIAEINDSGDDVF